MLAPAREREQPEQHHEQPSSSRAQLAWPLGQLAGRRASHFITSSHRCDIGSYQRCIEATCHGIHEKKRLSRSTQAAHPHRRRSGAHPARARSHAVRSRRPASAPADAHAHARPPLDRSQGARISPARPAALSAHDCGLPGLTFSDDSLERVEAPSPEKYSRVTRAERSRHVPQTTTETVAKTANPMEITKDCDCRNNP